jgi:F0F1-type ATP synthase assembly protein I
VDKLTSDRKYYFFALKIAGDFGASIGAPVVIFVLIGQYFDNKYHLTPYLTILGFVIAALISGKIIHQKAKKYGEEYKNLK